MTLPHNAGLSSFEKFNLVCFTTGQQVVEEILDAQRPGCPREFFNIPVNPDVTPDYDPERKGNVEMPVLRSRYDQRTGYSPNNPRQQVCTNIFLLRSNTPPPPFLETAQYVRRIEPQKMF